MKKGKILGMTIIILPLGLVIYYFYPEQKIKEGQKADKQICIQIFQERNLLQA